MRSQAALADAVANTVESIRLSNGSYEIGYHQEMEHGEALDAPPSLKEAIVYFPEPTDCLKHMLAKRQPSGVTRPIFLANQQGLQCSSRPRT
jgi:hypothetical protein